MYAAVKHPAYVTINEVSKAYGISKNHLMKITHELAQAGYLDTLRGRNGGLRLAKPAKEINVGHVMRLTETGTPLVECFDPATNQCVITPACKLRHVLHGALEAFFKKLEQTTLADLISDRRSLSSLYLTES
jgi:Rrf2 family nitric oxide-sensitive transcriptional repressor